MLRMTALSLSLSLLCLLSATSARAQALQPSALVLQPSAAQTAFDDAKLERLQQLRLAARAERRSAGFWLLGWGLANVIGGALMAGIGHEHQVWLAAGITTASFGAVNALLAPGLLDLSGARLRQIEAERATSAAELARVREADLVAELKSGQLFALNLGLDVFYIAAGLLLYTIGRVRADERGWEQGAGIAIAAQGVVLLGFDFVAWMATNRRAAALRAL
jgi:hypothetical protein